MVKKISCITFALLFMCMTFFSFGFESMAADVMVGNSNDSYYLPYPEPNTTENQGYMVCVDRYGSVITYFWQFHVSSSPADTISAEITKETASGHTGHLKFGAWGFSDSDTQVSYDIYVYDSNGLVRLSGHTKNESTCLNPGPDIIGVKVGGNCYFKDIGTYSYKFNVYFDDNGSASLLRELITTINYSRQTDGSILNTLQTILAETDTVEEQLSSVASYLESIKSILSDVESDIDVLLDKYDELIAEQKQSNTWLEKIFDLLNKSKEEEKQEATTQGNSSTSDGMNAIEDKGGDFTSSLGNLVGSMGYNGTDCSWTFPAIKLPAIPGVMDEVTLTEEQPIDFSYWVNQIPGGILLLIRSLFTAFLVVYCFRELYGTIEYVLTLRKGGGSE